MYSRKLRIYDFCARIFIRFISLFVRVKKQVMFESFIGKQYSDNPRAISEKMHELYPDYTLVWALYPHNYEECKEHIPKYIKVVIKKGLNLAYLFEIAKSACFVTNENLDPYFFKRKKQFFVQTYHGDRAFKKVLYDAWPDGKRPKPVMDEFYTDLAISGSVFGEKRYATSFHYNGAIYKNGSPRNDCLINIDTSRLLRIKAGLGIPKEVKILLFAPTFRDSKTNGQKVDIDIRRTLNCLQECGEKWICIVRGHSMVNSFAGLHEEEDILDLTHYYDMSDLLLIADMLITDYSSCATDFLLTKRPVILATFDIEDYKKNNREFAVDPEKSGFLLAKNQEQLETIIKNTSQEQYEESYIKVNKCFGTKESGHASEDICKLINQAYISKCCS